MSQVKFNAEAAIISALRKGEREALKSIYKTYWPMILQFVLLNSGTKEEAEELYQDAVIVFYEKLKNNDFTITCSIKTYIYSICRNKWLSELRGRKKIMDIESFVDVLHEAEEDESVLPVDEEVKKAVHNLGDPCYSLLVGYYYEKFTLEQIAINMKYASANVVKQQKFRCIERLKKVFMVNNHLSK